MKRYSTTIYTLLLICQPIRAFVELFHSSCNACVQYNSCEDLYIKTRQGFPSNNVNENIDVQQGNNSNDVEKFDDVIKKWRHCLRQNFLIVKKVQIFYVFIVFIYLLIYLVLSIIGSMENRFFCIKQNSKISEKFELPQPTLDLNSIPSLLALNGQPEIGKFFTIT